MTSLYYAVAAVTWISAVLGLVYALWAVRKSSGPARTSALCTLARGLALTVLAGAPFVYGSPALLMAVTGAMLLVQGGDALIGLAGKSLPRALGPLLMGLCTERAWRFWGFSSRAPFSLYEAAPCGGLILSVVCGIMQDGVFSK